MSNLCSSALICGLSLPGAVPTAHAQHHIPAKVDIAFNRYYTVDQLNDHVRAIAAAYPDLVQVRTLGQSLQGRDILIAIVTGPTTGPHDSKPAMWIDGNIHGNEVQASEVVLYTLWYLAKAYGNNEHITDLLDRTSFYLVPCVNPDGRASWFEDPHNSSSSRGNKRPIDNDGDGLFDEDGPDDLDGDGSITAMWRADADGEGGGRWVRSQTDARVFIQLKADERPAPGVTTYTFLGSEGLDNDGDGRINEDGPGGDDMNRDWPAGWHPSYVQWGAGPFPLSSPETRCIADFILAHPNIAGVQSYHNSGGMILRGPGAAHREGMYGRADAAVYDEIARAGEGMLPYYRSMVIHRDLYTVHGGFVNWTAESLGIFSFTNEMWTEGKYFQREVNNPTDEQHRFVRDRLQFGQTFKDYTEFDHPKYGPILVGGLNKWASRSTPTFLLEEECHRNFAFTAFHADQMPLLRFGTTDVARVPNTPDLWQVTLAVRNDRLIPTRSAHAQSSRIGNPDLLTIEPAAAVITAGRISSRFDEQMTPIRHEPARILLNDGIPGRTQRLLRLIVRGNEGAQITARYTADKAREITTTIELRETR